MVYIRSHLSYHTIVLSVVQTCAVGHCRLVCAGLFRQESDSRVPGRGRPRHVASGDWTRAGSSSRRHGNGRRRLVARCVRLWLGLTSRAVVAGSGKSGRLGLTRLVGRLGMARPVGRVALAWRGLVGRVQRAVQQGSRIVWSVGTPTCWAGVWCHVAGLGQ